MNITQADFFLRIKGWHVRREALLVTLRSSFGGNVPANSAIILEEGKDSCRRDVVMGIHCSFEIPEDKPIFLNWAIRVGTLKVCGMAEVAAHIVFVTPIDESAEVLQPLAEASLLRLRAEHCVGYIRSIENAGIVWAYAVGEVAEFSGADVTGGGGNWKYCRRCNALENIVFRKLGIADEFCKPNCIVHVTPLLLGNDDPCGVESWMWDDVWIDGFVEGSKGYGKVLLRAVR